MTSRHGRRRSRERGAALLVVMVAVALVTAAAVDLAYQARVSLRIAGNARDELRAQSLARGSVALGRLVLHFQARLDESSGRTAALLGTLGATGGTGVAGAIGAAAQQAAAGVPRPQLWRLVPVDSVLTSNLFGSGWSDGGTAAGGAGAARRPAAQAAPEGLPPAPGAGGPDGAFKAIIDDEDRKVNVQLDALDVGGLQGARLESFLALVGDRRWDFLFDREDAGGQRTSRTDLAVHLKDWVDDDQAQSSVTGLMERPFEAGFGDENFAYDRGPDRYKAKNARFDSLDELFLVTGVSDAFMAAFGDRLTVYLGRNSRMNVNADDPEELLRNARIMANPPLQPILSDPTFAERLQKSVRELTMGGFLAMSPYQFAQLLETMQLTVNASYLQAANTDQRGGFTDRSRVFRVRGVATVGTVEKSVEAVVTFDPDQAREQASQLGRLLHWREE
jgi:general secretion pathway protein K